MEEETKKIKNNIRQIEEENYLRQQEPVTHPSAMIEIGIEKLTGFSEFLLLWESCHIDPKPYFVHMS